jgi:hypothetical protein
MKLTEAQPTCEGAWRSATDHTTHINRVTNVRVARLLKKVSSSSHPLAR